MGSRNPVDSQNHRKEEKTFLQENGVDLMIRVHDTGIGMAITDQLVQLMGGEIVVESLKDKGSDFTVFLQLPLAEEGSIEEKTTTENREQNADNAFRLASSIPILYIEAASSRCSAVLRMLSLTEGFISCIMGSRFTPPSSNLWTSPVW